MRPFALVSALAVLAACSPKPAPAPALELDCSRGFEALAKDIAAQPGLSPYDEPGEPYRYYRPQGGGPTYVVTLEGAPGHPAVFKQEAVTMEGRKATMTTGCPFGDRDGYNRVLAYLQGLG